MQLQIYPRCGHPASPAPPAPSAITTKFWMARLETKDTTREVVRHYSGLVQTSGSSLSVCHPRLLTQEKDANNMEQCA